MLLNVALLIYWLRPFMCNKRSVYVSAAVYYALWLVCNYAGTSKEMDRILTIEFLVLAILIAWLLDNRRNYRLSRYFARPIFMSVSSAFYNKKDAVHDNRVSRNEKLPK